MHGHGARTSRTNQNFGMSKSRLFQAPRTFESAMQWKQPPTPAPFSDHAFWKLILILNSMKTKMSSFKPARKGINRLQIQTRSYPLSPGLSFVETGDKFGNHYKRLQSKLKSIRYPNQSTKLLKRSVYKSIREQLLKKRKQQKKKSGNISPLDNKDIEKVFRELKDYRDPPTARTPLQKSAGVSSLTSEKMTHPIIPSDPKPDKENGITDSKPSQGSKDFIIKQRTVEFMDPYTLEQLMLKKAKEMKSSQKQTSSLFPVEGMAPTVNPDELVLKTVMESLVSKSNSISNSMYENSVASLKQATIYDNGRQGNSLQGVSTEPYDILKPEQGPPLNQEMNFVERVKQMPNPTSDPLKSLGQTPEALINTKEPSLTKDKLRLYNDIKAAYELSEKINPDRAVFNGPVWAIPSTTEPPVILLSQSSPLQPGDIAWNRIENSRKQQQHEQVLLQQLQRLQQLQQLQGRQNVVQLNQLNLNQQNGVQNEAYQNNVREINTYSPLGLPQRSEYNGQSNANVEQNHGKKLEPVVMPEEQSSGNIKSQQSTTIDPNVESNGDNFKAFVNQHMQPDNLLDAMLVPDQKPRATFKIPAEAKVVYNDVEVKDSVSNSDSSFSVETKDIYELPNLKDDSSERK
ncbi:uncharacterized protein [Argopecten irradians]|uniref:uncharacterized protein n=1 Tax=Argopecten irradians TaxID=31199 RepID=UPI003718CE00